HWRWQPRARKPRLGRDTFGPMGQRERDAIAPPAHQLGRNALLVPHDVVGAGILTGVAASVQLLVDLVRGRLEELLELVHILFEHAERVEAAVHSELYSPRSLGRFGHLPSNARKAGAVFLGGHICRARALDPAEQDRT